MKEQYPLTSFSPFEIHRFSGSTEGISFLVLGSVHGNEYCGVTAIRRIITELSTGARRIKSGTVTFIPISNPEAYAAGQRYVSRDMNREFGPVRQPTLPVDFFTNILSEVMNSSNVLLDLHSFRASTGPFVFVGPENNNGQLEPFGLAHSELALAKSLGIRRMVYGWLAAYSKFADEQYAFVQKLGEEQKIGIEQARPTFGVGTTEYFRSLGEKYGVTLECGNHNDPMSVETAYDAIVRSLATLEMIDEKALLNHSFSESYRFERILIRKHQNDSLVKNFTPFEPVKQGQVLGSGTRLSCRRHLRKKSGRRSHHIQLP